MMAGNSRYVWTDEETKVFLALIQERNVTAILDGKQQRNAIIYQDLRNEMVAKGSR